MPALVTHHLFGEESIDRLPSGVITSEDERAAFLIANQGPDPYFFHVRSLNVKGSMEFGRRLHRCRISRQFAALREGVEHLQRHDAGVGRAFALGLLSHYVLDRAAHPFVYAQQWGIQELDLSLENAGSQVHGIIESDLDVLMLQLKRDGATTAAYPPESELITTARINKVAGALMSFVATSVYDMHVSAAEYGGAVADMKLAYRVIEPAGSPLSFVLGTAEGLVKDYSLMASLAHRVTTEPPAGAGNLDHRRWENPFTRVVSYESFPEVFERALDAYADEASRFVMGVDTTEITRHINYSGRVLEAHEEFEREE